MSEERRKGVAEGSYATTPRSLRPPPLPLRLEQLLIVLVGGEPAREEEPRDLALVPVVLAGYLLHLQPQPRPDPKAQVIVEGLLHVAHGASASRPGARVQSVLCVTTCDNAGKKTLEPAHALPHVPRGDQAELPPLVPEAGEGDADRPGPVGVGEAELEAGDHALAVDGPQELFTVPADVGAGRHLREKIFPHYVVQPFVAALLFRARV